MLSNASFRRAEDLLNPAQGYAPVTGAVGGGLQALPFGGFSGLAHSILHHVAVLVK